MYFDLNVPVPTSPHLVSQIRSKKGKGKQQRGDVNVASTAAPSSSQLEAITERVDLLIHLGYTVIAFNQTVVSKVDAKTFVNVLDPFLARLEKRHGVLYLKRLTLILDEESEKGTGITNANASLLGGYDLLAVIPTTSATLSLACLTLTTPSALTVHIVSLPLTLPRPPFNLKRTQVRATIKNGAVFEINYAGAMGGEVDAALGADTGASAKRNWWAGARELIRVTKGKGILVSGGVVNPIDFRAPRDVGNLVSLLDLPQNVAHDSVTNTPRLLILRAQTRKTYRAVFSEPTIVMPAATGTTHESNTGESFPQPPSGSPSVEGFQAQPMPPANQSPQRLKRLQENTGNVGSPSEHGREYAKRKKKDGEIEPLVVSI